MPKAAAVVFAYRSPFASKKRLCLSSLLLNMKVVYIYTSREGIKIYYRIKGYYIIIIVVIMKSCMRKKLYHLNRP